MKDLPQSTPVGGIGEQRSRLRMRLSEVLAIIVRADGAGLIMTNPVGFARYLAGHESCQIDEPDLLEMNS